LQQTIEHRAHRGDTAEQLAQSFDGVIGSEQSTEASKNAVDNVSGYSDLNG
jgi:hypothetical protein